MGCMILLGYFIEDYDETPVTVIQAEKHWSSNLDHVLDEEREVLEKCEVEVSAWRSRVSWLEQLKADDLQDRNRCRSGLVPLPFWKRKTMKHAKRKANASVPTVDKKQH